MTDERGPWPKPKDRTGYTLTRYKDKLYRVEGTGHSVATLLRQIKAGRVPLVNEDDPR